MKGLESYPHSLETLSLNPPSDSKIHAPSALNIPQPASEKQHISATLLTP